MNVVQISDAIREGKKVGGLRINHHLLTTPKQIAESVKRNGANNIRIMCTHLDLQVLYYRMTGTEYAGDPNKHIMIQELISVGKAI